VINFPQIGFNLNPNTPGTPAIPPPPAQPPTPTTDPAPAGPTGSRRSPLDTIAALPSPGILQPALPTPAGLPPTPGMVPDTFRNEPTSDQVGPRLGALGLAATLAVAVAALRGTHTVLSTWWENRQARQLENGKLREARLKHRLAMENLAGKAGQQRAKNNRVPSSSEFGRKSLGNRSSSGGGKGSSGKGGRGPGGSGSGSGSKSSGPGGRGPGSSPGSRRSPKKHDTAGNGTRPGRKNPGNGSGTGAGGGKDHARKNTPKGPHRNSQGGGAALKKQQKHTARHGKDGGRTSLPDALKHDTAKAAARRLKKRRKNSDKPALWAADKPNSSKTPKTKKPGPGSKNTTPKASPSPKAGPNGKTSTKNGKTPNQAPNRLDQAMWSDLKKKAQKRWKKRTKRDDRTPPIWASSKKTSGGPAGKKKQKPSPGGKGSKKNTGGTWWGKASNHARGAQTPPRTGPASGPQRQSPFAHAAQSGGVTYTVVSEHIPGSRARIWQPTALPARPGTTRPQEASMPPNPPARIPSGDPRLRKARHQAARTAIQTLGRHMDDQHATEITLDDALDQYTQFAEDGFTTHDQALKLADRARTLRSVLEDLAEDLAVNHNLIGPLFSTAMAHMAESMDLVARMADEMQTSSLEAAEGAEAAANDLNDTYRPYTAAAADAGLSTPSAPIHNQS
ncbi:hypothetical protein, partial [Streptomyces sp. MH192]